MMISKLRFTALFLALVLVGAGCSRILVNIFSPADSGAFVLSGTPDGSGKWNLTWKANDRMTPGLFDPDYNVLYAYYLYQSTTSPYDGYSLIARHYNTWPATVWSNIEWSQGTNGVITNTNRAVNFGMPAYTNGAPTNVVFASTAFTHVPVSGVSYVRLVRWKFRKVTSAKTFSNWTTGSNESRDNITHETYGDASSSFVALTN